MPPPPSNHHTVVHVHESLFLFAQSLHPITSLSHCLCFLLGFLKGTINKWDYMKLKTFCTVGCLFNKMKRETTEWENIFTNDMSDEVNIQNL